MTNNDVLFMGMAMQMAMHSKCVSKQVGCVIVKNDSIISSGVNGTPSGYTNCCDVFDRDNFDREKHHEWANVHELHAEMNAVAKAQQNKISLEGSTFYVTLQPCFACIRFLVGLQSVERIVYYLDYDKSNRDSLVFAEENGILVQKFEGKL